MSWTTGKNCTGVNYVVEQDGANKRWIEVIDSFHVNSPVDKDVTNDSRPNDVETDSATHVWGIDWAPHCLLYS